MAFSDSSAVTPLVLAAYLSPWVQGHHVALLGSTTNGWVEELRRAGARSVHPHRLDERALVREAAFGVSVFPNASFQPSFAEVLAEARRITSKDGIVAVIVAHPPAIAQAAPLGYYELYDELSAQFPYVKMIGQYPFEGFTLVDFTAEDEPAIALDTSLVSEMQREPLLYIGLGSYQPLTLENYSIVEVPEVADAKPPVEVEKPVAAESAATALQALQQDNAEAIHALQQDNAAAIHALQQDNAAALQVLQQEVDVLRREQMMADELRKNLATLTQEREELARQNAQLACEVDALKTAQNEVRHPRYVQLETEMAGLQESHAQEVRTLEAALLERAHEINKLRHEINQRGEMVRELLDGAALPVEELALGG